MVRGYELQSRGKASDNKVRSQPGKAAELFFCILRRPGRLSIFQYRKHDPVTLEDVETRVSPLRFEHAINRIPNLA